MKLDPVRNTAATYYNNTQFPDDPGGCKPSEPFSLRLIGLLIFEKEARFYTGMFTTKMQHSGTRPKSVIMAN